MNDNDDDSDFQPVVGDDVILDSDSSSKLAAGQYTVTDVNSDGSFHVNSHPERITTDRVSARIHYAYADPLIGRVVGWSVPYLLGASQVVDGESLQATRTVWGRVVEAFLDGEGDETLGVDMLHNKELRRYIPRGDIHTTMPKGS